MRGKWNYLCLVQSWSHAILNPCYVWYIQEHVILGGSTPPARLTCTSDRHFCQRPWWRHQMETFSALLALVRGIHRWFPSQRPVARSFDVFSDLRLNKRLSKQSRRQWFEIPSRLLWRHYNASHYFLNQMLWIFIVCSLDIEGKNLDKIRIKLHF